MARRSTILPVLALGSLCLAVAPVPARQASPPGHIAFLARNSFVEANGTFHRWRVTEARVDRADPAASFVEVEIDVTSIDTGIARRDDHLRSADFFDVATWPRARVRIHSARPAGRSESGHPLFAARFGIRIRDVEKSLPGTFVLIDESRIEGALTLDRTEFGVGSPRSRWNPLSVHDQVVVEYSASLPALQEAEEPLNPSARRALPAGVATGGGGG